MGLRISDANEEQKAFLDEIEHDPTKGEKWIDLLKIVTDCMADIQAVRKAGTEIDPILLRFLIRTSALRMVNATDAAFPFDRKSDADRNPRAPAIRLDVVKFFHLGGFLLGEEWNEDKLTME